MAVMIDMKQLLEDLRATKVVRVTGSYADGTQSPDSDIDFYVKPDDPEAPYASRNMKRVTEVLEWYGVAWESTITGYIFTHESENQLPIQLEFSDLFDPREGKLPSVTVYGVEFGTYLF
jgi:predicted nucleotidyltransferase